MQFQLLDCSPHCRSFWKPYKLLWQSRSPFGKVIINRKMRFLAHWPSIALSVFCPKVELASLPISDYIQFFYLSTENIRLSTSREPACLVACTTECNAMQRNHNSSWRDRLVKVRTCSFSEQVIWPFYLLIFCPYSWVALWETFFQTNLFCTPLINFAHCNWVLSNWWC